MMTRTRTAAVTSRTRAGWAREGGARRRYSTARVRRALKDRRSAGWIAPLPAQGPRYERLTLLHRTHPLALVAQDYAAGARWFDRRFVERMLGHRLETEAGARALAAAGFAVLRIAGARVELRAADARTARLVNRARLGPQYRGYDVRKVVGAVLALPPKAKRRRPITDDRRLEAALVLQDTWLIDGEDLLNCRPFVRLRSHWTYPADPQAVAG